MLRVLLISTVSSIALATAAFAADLPNTKGPAPFMPPPPPPVFNWTGFYIGANVGYDWANDPVTDVNGWDYNNGTVGGVVRPNGVTGGGQIGYNWQFTPFLVAGVEAEGGYMSLSGSKSYCLVAGSYCSGSPDSAGVSGGVYGAVTGKLGFTVDRILLYAKGGVAFGDFQVSFSSPNYFGRISNSVNVGWTVGGGLEYALTPNWSIKGEYDFYDFGHTSDNVTYDDSLYQFRHNLTANKVVVGVNYRFDMFGPPAPVVAKY